MKAELAAALIWLAFTVGCAIGAIATRIQDKEELVKNGCAKYELVSPDSDAVRFVLPCAKPTPTPEAP